MKRSKDNKILRILLFICALIGIIFSIYLVISEIYRPGFCPLLFNIPACYLVIASFILVLISLFLKKIQAVSVIFYTGAILGLGIAIWFSIGQIIGTKECPGLLNIPLCYGSAVLFMIIIISGSIEIKRKLHKEGV